MTPAVLHPSHFQVNQAWIAFQLNGAPLRTEQDGDFNLIALMDAASCFILASLPLPTTMAEPSGPEARRLLSEGQAHKKKLPETLFVPTDLLSSCLVVEAERRSITVVRVPERELHIFIGDAKESFALRFSGNSTQ